MAQANLTLMYNKKGNKKFYENGSKHNCPFVKENFFIKLQHRRQWDGYNSFYDDVVVASAGPHANHLHLTPDRNHVSTS